MSLNKPIALLCKRYQTGRDWILEHLIIKHFNQVSCRAVDDKGQTYIIVYDMEHIVGYELSDFKILDCTDSDLIAYTKTRVREIK